MTYMAAVFVGLSTEAYFELRPPGVSLNCISISFQSNVECALSVSEMVLHKNQFAPRDGYCVTYTLADKAVLHRRMNIHLTFQTM